MLQGLCNAVKRGKTLVRNSSKDNAYIYIISQFSF